MPDRDIKNIIIELEKLVLESSNHTITFLDFDKFRNTLINLIKDNLNKEVDWIIGSPSHYNQILLEKYKKYKNIYPFAEFIDFAEEERESLSMYKIIQNKAKQSGKTFQEFIKFPIIKEFGITLSTEPNGMLMIQESQRVKNKINQVTENCGVYIPVDKILFKNILFTIRKKTTFLNEIISGQIKEQDLYKSFETITTNNEGSIHESNNEHQFLKDGYDLFMFIMQYIPQTKPKIYQMDVSFIYHQMTERKLLISTEEDFIEWYNNQTFQPELNEIKAHSKLGGRTSTLFNSWSDAYKNYKKALKKA